MKRTTNDFINELKKIQPNITVLGEYINTDTKILIADELGIKYMSTPYKLLQKRKPSILSATNKNEAFAIMAKKKHGDKYDYSYSIYKNAFSKVKVFCVKHGFFEVSPANHLFGNECAKCASEQRGLNRRSNTAEFINKAKKIYNNFYSYNLSNYITAIKKIEIICPIHGIFKQQPSVHLCGSGCPMCSFEEISKKAIENSVGWSYSKWLKKINDNDKSNPRLYIIECFNEVETFIKVGITFNELKKRFHNKKSMPYNYRIIKEYFSTPKSVFYTEKCAKKEFKEFRYLPLINFNGAYECFDKKCIEKLRRFCDENLNN